jgi:hypothetical protein
MAASQAETQKGLEGQTGWTIVFCNHHLYFSSTRAMCGQEGTIESMLGQDAAPVPD